MKRNGAIPPGKAGLIVLAIAMVPIAIRKFRPFVRWVGKQLSNAGSTVTKVADEADRDHAREHQAKASNSEVKEEPATAVPATTTKTTASRPKAAKPQKPSKPKSASKRTTTAASTAKRPRTKPV